LWNTSVCDIALCTTLFKVMLLILAQVQGR